MNQLALELDGPRLSRQCADILDLLENHRAVSNRALACIALKYTSRLSDLRKAGHDVRVVCRDHETGLVFYALFRDGKALHHRG